MGLLDRHRKTVARAAELRRGGDPHAAIETLADVLTAEPDHVPATVEMARALRLIGDPAEAEQHLRRALELVLDFQVLIELAQALAEQGRVAEAEEIVDAAIFMADKNPRLDPGEPLLVRATIAAAEGRDDDARAILSRFDSDRAIRKRSSAHVKTFAAKLRASLEG